MTTLKNLALALINATVLLVALCLVLALLITQSAERASDRFSEAVSSLAPVRSEVTQINDSLEGLRSDVQALAQRPNSISDDRVLELNDQIAALNERLDTVNTRLSELGEVPDEVVKTAIDYAAERVSAGVNAYRNCTAKDPDGEA